MSTDFICLSSCLTDSFFKINYITQINKRLWGTASQDNPVNY